MSNLPQAQAEAVSGEATSRSSLMWTSLATTIWTWARSKTSRWMGRSLERTADRAAVQTRLTVLVRGRQPGGLRTRDSGHGRGPGGRGARGGADHRAAAPESGPAPRPLATPADIPDPAAQPAAFWWSPGTAPDPRPSLLWGSSGWCRPARTDPSPGGRGPHHRLQGPGGPGGAVASGGDGAAAQGRTSPR